MLTLRINVLYKYYMHISHILFPYYGIAVQKIDILKRSNKVGSKKQKTKK